jgi:UPF0271 protein
MLGCDTGEAEDAIGRARELALLAHVDAVSIACGGHAGDSESMRSMIEVASRTECAIGAHPSYPDRPGFGRRAILIDDDTLRASIIEQLKSLKHAANTCDARVGFVKAHGELYHAIACDPVRGCWFAEICTSVLGDIAVVLPLGSDAIEQVRRSGCEVLVEGFCDRGYDDRGVLIPRGQPGAMITDPDDALVQTRRLLRDSACELLCVHSDSPNAIEIARSVRQFLDSI